MRPMRAWPAVPLLVAALVAAGAKPAAAQRPASGVIDRIEAVVGHDIILLSDVRAREVPFLEQIDRDSSSDAVKEAKRAELEKELVGRMVDEHLEAAYAAAHFVRVTPEEMDSAETAVANENNISVDQVEQAARAHGMTRASYRAELARQLLDAMVVELAVKPRLQRQPKLSEAEWNALLEQERRHWLDELKRATYVDMRL
jgi:hypothetical protein